MYNKVFISPPESLSRSFTLIELIVVIIIVGILAAVGMTQYSTLVEKGRFAEARVRIGAISKLAYEYYLNNGTYTGITNPDLNVDNTCYSTDYYRYTSSTIASTVSLYAYRCTSGGKSPQGLDYRLRWRVSSTGVLSQYAYWNSDVGAWVITSNWNGCCR
jgi:type IV pilus assembly protein PilE